MYYPIQYKLDAHIQTPYFLTCIILWKLFIIYSSTLFMPSIFNCSRINHYLYLQIPILLLSVARMDPSLYLNCSRVVWNMRWESNKGLTRKQIFHLHICVCAHTDTDTPTYIPLITFSWLPLYLYILGCFCNLEFLKKCFIFPVVYATKISRKRSMEIRMAHGLSLFLNTLFHLLVKMTVICLSLCVYACAYMWVTTESKTKALFFFSFLTDR